MRLLAALLALASLAAIAGIPPAAARAGGTVVCKLGVNDEAPQKLPASLVPQAEQAFGLHNMSPEQVRRSTVVRCADGHLLACNYGANLPCGKAPANHSMNGADQWCRNNPDADFIPAYITGHDSIYRWRCALGVPAAAGPVEPVDAQGFIARYWRPLQ